MPTQRERRIANGAEIRAYLEGAAWLPGYTVRELAEALEHTEAWVRRNIGNAQGVKPCSGRRLVKFGGTVLWRRVTVYRLEAAA